MDHAEIRELLKLMNTYWPTLFLHSANVANLVSKICYKLSLTEIDRETAIIGALLHDVGKMFIRREIIDKPGPLTMNEWTEIKKHPWLGAFEVADKGGNEALIYMIRYHHERWDGKGYEGLRGEGIPLHARIIALADACDAMTSSRPYRKPIKNYEAIQEVHKDSGTHFDPHLVAELAKDTYWQTTTYLDPASLASQIIKEMQWRNQMIETHDPLYQPLIYAQTQWLDSLRAEVQLTHIKPIDDRYVDRFT